MSPIGWFTALALLAAVPAAAQASAPAPAAVPTPMTPSLQVTAIEGYPVQEVAFPGGVRGLPSITYQTLDGYRPLLLDLYLPPAPAATRPALVVFVHGGGWLGGDARTGGPVLLGALVALAARGYAVAAVNYRLSGEARFPAQRDDVAAALAFLRGRAGALGIDAGRIVAWGVSAGGTLAALAAVSCGTAGTPPCLRGVAAWYAPFDMTTLTGHARQAGAASRDDPDAPEWKLLGCFKAQCRPEQLRAASPAALVTPATPPMLLVAGDADATVPVQQTQEMAARLAAAGVARELLILPGLAHNLSGRTPADTRAGFDAALAATFRFIERALAAPAPGAAAR